MLLALYKEKGPAFLDDLNGIFAFILYDAEQDAYLIGRDHMGIIPYTGRDEHGNFYVASEMKALVPVCKSVETFRRDTTCGARMANSNSGTNATGWSTARSSTTSATRPS